jgi:2-oxoglutarate ferredoxin oxidoreductase subunit beta
MTTAELTRKDFVSGQDLRWCPGCGDYMILATVLKILPQLGRRPEDNVFISGIGCSSRFPYYVESYGMHSIHGRAPTVATGLKVANPGLALWLVTGDGDGFSIGGNHLMHLLRRNVDCVILLFNNEIYGLTKGQYSPTSREGTCTKTSPQGSIDHPVNPCAFALGAGATFVARSTDSDAAHLEQTLLRAARHKGCSFVEILQNCVIFNDGVHAHVTDKTHRADRQLLLEHGQPLVFGAEGARKAIAIRGFEPEVVALGAGEAEGVMRHDEHLRSPAYAGLIAQLSVPDFPVPLGVLRALDRPCYEEQVAGQVAQAQAARPGATLAGMYRSFGQASCWTVAPSD